MFNTMKLANGMILTVLFLASGASGRDPRSTTELNHCVKIAEPLIHDPGYVFPLTINEIRTVCKKWDQFVECIRRYTKTFLSRAQRVEFDAAINPSMQSIHQLCIQDAQYEQAYLYYAPCMKKISIDGKFCGERYRYLAKIAESVSETGPAICCGYHKFRSCVLEEAKRQCDRADDPTRPTAGNDSSHFVSAMLNRALGFLLQKCSNYEPETQDCHSYISPNGEAKNTNFFSNLGISSSNSARGRDGRIANELPPINSNSHSNTNDVSNAEEQLPPPDTRRTFPDDHNSIIPKPLVTNYPLARKQTTRFTWTTPANTFVTRNSSLGYNRRFAESQQYKGSSATSANANKATYAIIISILANFAFGKTLS